MAIVRSIPARQVYSPQSELTRLFSTFFDSATPVNASLAQSGRSFAPALDVVEQGEEFVLSADLPGMTESDVKVEVLDGVLTISGERQIKREDSGEGYRRIERASGSFTRRVTLPKGIAADAVTASFANGVLEVHVPKPAATKPHLVEIGTAA